MTTAANQVVAAADRHRRDPQRLPGHRSGGRTRRLDAPAPAPAARRPRRLRHPSPRQPPRSPGGPGPGRVRASARLDPAAPAPADRRPLRTGRRRFPHGSPAAPQRSRPRGSYCEPHGCRGVVCLGLAVLIGGSGLWTLARPPGVDLTGQVLRAVAPTQLAAGGDAGRGGDRGPGRARHDRPDRADRRRRRSGRRPSAAGSWQGARYAARREASAGGGCGSAAGCGGCAKVCGSD